MICKTLRSFESWVLVNNDSCRKLFSSLESPARIYESFKDISVPFFIPDSNLFSSELDNFTFRVLYWVTLYYYFIKVK